MTDLRNYQFFHDSLVNDNKNKQLAEINIKYETEKKNQHIADLEKQTALQTRLQLSTVRQNRIVRNSLIAGAALLTLVAAVLYRRWRPRRRMSLRLEKLSRRQQKLLIEKETLLGEKEKLIGEKEWLLREIHHRVKNNLQIVISLLNMQAGQLKDEIAISAFQEIGARVNTISLVHKKLYQETQDMASIDMREYICELVTFLEEGLSGRQTIAFNLDVQQLTLDPAQCVPVGLILNEAITNAIKYAFPGDTTSPAAINISLKEEQENYITLRVADNGIGLPAGFDLANARSLGLQLIQTLVAQLDGTLEMISLPAAAAHRDPAAHPNPPAHRVSAAHSAPSPCRGLTVLIRFPWVEPMSDASPPCLPTSANLDGAPLPEAASVILP
jgi:two-component sensor histidine kinase